MSRQCPNCRKITKGQVASCEGCGFAFDERTRNRGFAETCLRIGVVITIAASAAAVIAKIIL